MRPAFGLADDSTRLSLTVTLFLMGAGVGHLFYGPIADAVGRKPTLAGSLVLYAAAALVAALAPSLGECSTPAGSCGGFAAAGPRVLTQAIVRDRFAGTAMARVLTLIQAVFFIAPILAPGLGKLPGGGRLMALGDGLRRDDRADRGDVVAAPRRDPRPCPPPAAAAAAGAGGLPGRGLQPHLAGLHAHGHLRLRGLPRLPGQHRADLRRRVRPLELVRSVLHRLRRAGRSGGLEQQPAAPPAARPPAGARGRQRIRHRPQPRCSR